MDLHPNWEYVSDGVMGGVSRGSLHQMAYLGRPATVLRGQVSLDNNGGFVQIAFDLRPGGGPFDASAWTGLELDMAGNGAAYDVRLRTSDLTRPWQSFRQQVTVTPGWNTYRLPFAGFQAHRTEATFDPAQLRRVGILAIGREFNAEVAVGAVRLLE